ncbi:small heat shock protein [Leucogyrophana mollusca]|uniref:Small heat shock protein n=1 Tax=Leucogyrophana mollusca TaxID=85980 RepID=A0ACB8BG89_9AGAM|nr:small heat shock protein [Leucogyrophana mollusca]
MSVVHFHYDPFTEFDRLFDDAFSSRFHPGKAVTESGRRAESAQRPSLFRPRMDLRENAEANTVTAAFELPGLKNEDVNIDIHNDRLTIAGETKTSQEHDEAGYAIRERSWGKFSRTLQLPQGTKAEDVKAKMEHGVLTVTFPKANPEQERKRITID